VDRLPFHFSVGERRRKNRQRLYGDVAIDWTMSIRRTGNVRAEKSIYTAPLIPAGRQNLFVSEEVRLVVGPVIRLAFENSALFGKCGNVGRSRNIKAHDLDSLADEEEKKLIIGVEDEPLELEAISWPDKRRGGWPRFPPFSIR
jgi:hypothetical protein